MKYFKKTQSLTRLKKRINEIKWNEIDGLETRINCKPKKWKAKLNFETLYRI